MIWIVSKRIIQSVDELKNRRQYIEDITQAEVSPWTASEILPSKLLESKLGVFRCTSKKGEYGIVVTAHIDEIQRILNEVLQKKKALVAINSCAINKRAQKDIYALIKRKNINSELFFAKQEKLAIPGYGECGLNYIDDVGTFGFGTTQSERELFQNRKLGLSKAIRAAFTKVIE